MPAWMSSSHSHTYSPCLSHMQQQLPLHMQICAVRAARNGQPACSLEGKQMAICQVQKSSKRHSCMQHRLMLHHCIGSSLHSRMVMCMMTRTGTSRMQQCLGTAHSEIAIPSQICSRNPVTHSHTGVSAVTGETILVGASHVLCCQLDIGSNRSYGHVSGVT